MSAVPSIPADCTLHDRIREAVEVTKYYLRGGFIIACSWSSGKDSASALNLVLTAQLELKAEGIDTAPVIIKHSDTLVENPLVVNNARDEMQHIQTFAAAQGIPVRIEVVSPSLRERFTVRTIGTGSLPSFPGSKRDCTSDWKASPMQRLDRQLQKEYGIGKDRYITVTGLRFSESTGRRARMTERGEQSLRPWKNKNGDYFLSPIAHWDTDHVWEYLGLVRNGAMPGYSDLSATFNTYEQAGGSSCAVVADMALDSVGQSKPYSARNGCFCCMATGISDPSLQTMLDNPANDYMRGLNDLRNFLWATRWDFSRREWVGRSVKHGYVRLMPDTYSMSMREELLRYCLTLQIEEEAAAQRAGLDMPRFTIISLEDLIAIDYEFSRLGGAKPFRALAIYDEIYRQGHRFAIPDIPVFAAQALPDARFYYVGEEWNDTDYQQWGLQDKLIDAFASECYGDRTVSMSDGHFISGVMVENTFSVDAESASLVLELELDYLLQTYHDSEKANPTEAARYYLRMGTVALGSRQLKHTDFMLKRTGWKHSKGLIGETANIPALLDDTISMSELDSIIEAEASAVVSVHHSSLNEEQMSLFD